MFRLLHIMGGIFLLPTTAICFFIPYLMYLSNHGLSLDIVFFIAVIGYPLFCLWFLLLKSSSLLRISEVPKYISFGLVIGIIESMLLVYFVASELISSGTINIVDSIMVSFYMFFPLILVLGLLFSISYKKRKSK